MNTFHNIKAQNQSHLGDACITHCVIHNQWEVGLGVGDKGRRRFEHEGSTQVRFYRHKLAFLYLWQRTPVSKFHPDFIWELWLASIWPIRILILVNVENVSALKAYDWK